MKKIVSLILVGVLASAFIAGCNGATDEGVSTGTAATTAGKATPTPDASGSPTPTPDASGSPTPTTGTTPAPTTTGK